MLDALKRWVSGHPADARPVDVVQRWARDRGLTTRIDQATGRLGASAAGGDAGACAWSLEWGPSQRSYLVGDELCLRAEVPVPAPLQVLVLDRALRARMERDVFESYVQDLHTRVDMRTPPEMRWLVMLPPVPPTAATALGAAFSAVASDGPWVARWLDDDLSQRLAAMRPSSASTSDNAAPFVLMLSRGRLTLRTALASPEPATLEALAGLLQRAAASAVSASAA